MSTRKTPAEEAIVLVGGLGKRLRGVVTDVPKPLAPVAGRPFLAWVLEALEAGGVRRAVLAAGHMADVVQSTIGTRWGAMEIVTAIEPAPLGTGGAVRFAARSLLGDSAHVVNGDTFLRYDPRALERVTREAGAAIGIALARVPDVARYGAVEVRDGRVVRFHEKGETGPGRINAGCYFLTAPAFAALPEGPAFSFESEVLPQASMRGEVAAFDATRDFIDIGVPEDYARAQQWFTHLP